MRYLFVSATLVLALTSCKSRESQQAELNEVNGVEDSALLVDKVFVNSFNKLEKWHFYSEGRLDIRDSGVPRKSLDTSWRVVKTKLSGSPNFSNVIEVSFGDGPLAVQETFLLTSDGRRFSNGLYKNFELDTWPMGYRFINRFNKNEEWHFLQNGNLKILDGGEIREGVAATWTLKMEKLPGSPTFSAIIEVTFKPTASLPATRTYIVAPDEKSFGDGHSSYELVE